LHGQVPRFLAQRFNLNREGNKDKMDTQCLKARNESELGKAPKIAAQVNRYKLHQRKAIRDLPVVRQSEPNWSR
jgi:hypothetical protein